METKIYDYIIIGAGVAGLASAQYAARGGLKTVALDLAGAGGQVSQITELENYPGIFPAITGTELIKSMENQAISFGAEIVSTNVKSIDKPGKNFVVQTGSGIYEAPALCIATGAIHKTLNVPGEKELAGRGVSYCAVCDGPFFKNRKIVVVGGGDSACTEAIYLSSISNNVKIIHRRDSFRAQKAVVDKMLNAGIEPVYNTVVKSINGTQKVESLTVENVKTGEIQSIEADAVFIFAGMGPQTSLVEMIPKDEAGYILTNEEMETSLPGLYAAGDVRSKSFRQVVTAVSDGAIAAHSVCEKLIKN